MCTKDDCGGEWVSEGSDSPRDKFQDLNLNLNYTCWFSLAESETSRAPRGPDLTILLITVVEL